MALGPAWIQENFKPAVEIIERSLDLEGGMPLGPSRKPVSLKRWLRLSLSGFAASLILAMAWGVWPLLLKFQEGERNLHAIKAYHLLLTTANRISAERGPSNVVMSIEPGSDAAATRRLTEFRAVTDLSLDTALGMDRQWAEPFIFQAIAQTISDAHDELVAARAEVDRIAAMPAGSRSREDVRQAVNGMIEVVDHYQTALDTGAQALALLGPIVAGSTMVAQSVSDLREFGGRIASHIIPSVSRGERLTEDEIERFYRAEGRLLEINRLLGTQRLFSADPEFQPLAQDIGQQFFGQGLGLLRRIVAEGKAGASYSIEPSQLTALYVPHLKPLEDMRNLYLSHMIGMFEERRATALSRLGLTLLGSLLCLGAAFWFLGSVRRKILLPLLTAQEAVVSLAGNRSIERMSLDSSISEMRTLFSAVSVLATKINERRRLMEDLRVQAETDRLTELANRRGFDSMTEDALRHGRAGHLGIMYFDLDHFKSVNDKLGHQAGDALLVEVANRLRSQCDARVCLARLGGDEFAALVQGLDEGEQRGLAKRIVGRLAEAFEIDGHRTHIGVSIGIAIWRDAHLDFETLCRQADMALYEAKAQGRNGFRVFHPRMEMAFRERAIEQAARMEHERGGLDAAA